MSIERNFDITFAAKLAVKEKQIQQNYRPVIGVHKWFARRPGTLFRNLLLAEFNGSETSESAFLHSHGFKGIIADPFMGGGTPVIEANRLGFHVIGTDVNPMAYWIVRQELAPLDADAFVSTASEVASDLDVMIGHHYSTECLRCGDSVPIKYFVWVKTLECHQCGYINDLFPGYLLAENVRHPKYVLVCSECSELVEVSKLPSTSVQEDCPYCGKQLRVIGPAKRGSIDCRCCETKLFFPAKPNKPFAHRMWAIEYHCYRCKTVHNGRFFKRPSQEDLDSYTSVEKLLQGHSTQYIPDELIPAGDETDRLHRWGYQRWRELFNSRQLYGLSLLQQRIANIETESIRHALATVFSDILRYQNMLCRYDTYALKCQDIFSIHGFPVGLVQCENNLIGIPKIGSGGFRHFVEKYLRAKQYCSQPFETISSGRSKRVISISGESIAAAITEKIPEGDARQALLKCLPAAYLPLDEGILDGVFTDPPYYDNVQYAELMDFCYAWLRRIIAVEIREFSAASTRSQWELTGNVTEGRGIAHFAAGLSDVFTHFGRALRPGAPFVFTYHHNDPMAYAPIVLALLDAKLYCTEVLPAPAEMAASIHINGTGSSILDSVFVCRREEPFSVDIPLQVAFAERLQHDCSQIGAAGIQVTLGDAKCLVSGHIARWAVHSLFATWETYLSQDVVVRLEVVRSVLRKLALLYSVEEIARQSICVRRREQLELEFI